jgi:hypothetical protein
MSMDNPTEAERTEYNKMMDAADIRAHRDVALTALNLCEDLHTQLQAFVDATTRNEQFLIRTRTQNWPEVLMHVMRLL